MRPMTAPCRRNTTLATTATRANTQHNAFAIIPARPAASGPSSQIAPATAMAARLPTTALVARTPLATAPYRPPAASVTMSQRSTGIQARRPGPPCPTSKRASPNPVRHVVPTNITANVIASVIIIEGLSCRVLRSLPARVQPPRCRRCAKSRRSPAQHHRSGMPNVPAHAKGNGAKSGPEAWTRTRAELQARGCLRARGARPLPPHRR